MVAKAGGKAFTKRKPSAFFFPYDAMWSLLVDTHAERFQTSRCKQRSRAYAGTQTASVSELHSFPRPLSPPNSSSLGDDERAVEPWHCLWWASFCDCFSLSPHQARLQSLSQSDCIGPGLSDRGRKWQHWFLVEPISAGATGISFNHFMPLLHIFWHLLEVCVMIYFYDISLIIILIGVCLQRCSGLIIKVYLLLWFIDLSIWEFINCGLSAIIPEKNCDKCKWKPIY